MRPTSSSLVLTLAFSVAALCACGSSDQADGNSSGSGGLAGVGGGSAGNGGGAVAGGTAGASGQTGLGGTSTSGGAVGTGGNTASGGATPGSGGAVGTGGASVSGGATGTGGSTSSGGSGRGGRTGAGGAEAGGAADGGSSGAATGGSDTGAGGSTVVAACSTGTAQAGDITVSMSDLQQKISGFGVSSAWAGDFRDAQNDPDMLWSTTTGAGLTLHRIRIGGGTTSETKIAQKAVEYGVKVWATPWEVNRADTDRDNCPGTSSCDPPPKLVDPQDWANRLVDFVNTMKDAGVPIYAISAENEPDSGGMNGTTSYTASELATWIGSYLGPALANTDTLVMAPETMNWYGFPGYFDAIQQNSDAWNYVGIFASHEYGLGPSNTEPAIIEAGKEYWETEVDTGRASDDPSGDGISTALRTAEAIHNDLTKANLNAWHYWWLWAGGTSGVYDTDTNVWTKRLWIMGNFSRFVRPGFMRVSTSGSAPSGVLVSAYTNTADGTVAVVAINKNSSDSQISLFVSDNAPCTVTPWVTSASDSLASKDPITVTDARFSATLPGMSVTTFVGTP